MKENRYEKDQYGEQRYRKNIDNLEMKENILQKKNSLKKSVVRKLVV